jgi:hypothetical protein
LAELWWVLEGLLYAKKLQFMLVDLNIDSFLVVGTITFKRCSSPLGRLIDDKIRRLLASEWNVVVHHSYRS